MGAVASRGLSVGIGPWFGDADLTWSSKDPMLDLSVADSCLSVRLTRLVLKGLRDILEDVVADLMESRANALRLVLGVAARRQAWQTKADEAARERNMPRGKGQTMRQ